MVADFRRFDEHGFPLPPQFSDLKYHDDEASQRRKISPNAKRWLLLAMVAAVLALLFGPYLFNFLKETAADWLSDRAEHKYFNNDFSGALSDLNWAVDWNPNAWESYRLRGAVRLELNDLNGSLADFTRLIEMAESQTGLRNREHLPLNRNELIAVAYSQRSWVYMRMQRGREAIDDATQALRYSKDPEYLNGRAYVRALAKMELPDALNDVEKALAQQGASEPNFLDTRGYVLHLLNRNNEALKDLDNALHLEQQDFTRRVINGPRQLEQALRQQKLALAVMYHHRGLVYEKLDRAEEAAHDLKRGDELGYDEAHGVF